MSKVASSRARAGPCLPACCATTELHSASLWCPKLACLLHCPPTTKRSTLEQPLYIPFSPRAVVFGVTGGCGICLIVSSLLKHRH
ncbi:hypothetical protein CONLIGDRAFT_73087 [Coniochaeta ligniaria NRRL 30616]|uniref:Uncharacterized protein n=1 Tax=Coniochaeta ligniaria NRRL 30616 TaxID=1408157 RepID=A0A1J7J4W1_9PEZI|nr:hypothetical protein CONLIGDRAFT_73087 [Coniochaeta ligniaria NRRL 30616]